MSFVPVQNPTDPIANIKTFPITEGADDLEIQAVVVVDTDGAPIEVATDATVSGIGTSIVAALEDLLTELALKADLTETQPISAAALPLPAGASTATKQDDQTTLLTAIKAKTDNLDVALSTRAVTGLTDTQLRATPVPVSGPLTDTQLRASAVPVSAAALPLPSGAATSAKQDEQTGWLSTLATEAQLGIVAGILGDSRDLLGFIKDSNELIAQEATLQSADTKLLTIAGDTGNLDVQLSTRATEATLALIKAKTDNLDVALSTRAVTGLTNTELRATPVNVLTPAASDATVLNVLNEAVTIAIGSNKTVGFSFSSAASFIGTVVAEQSDDGGATWRQALFFGSYLSFLSLGLNGAASIVNPTAEFGMISVEPGATHARIRVSAVTSGTIVGTITANSLIDDMLRYALGAANLAVPGMAAQVGGSDGSLLRIFRTDTTGRLTIVGAQADGSGVTGNPVLTAGQDGTNVQSFKTDTTGRQEVIGGAAANAALAGNPVPIAASDGTNAQIPRVFDVDTGAGTQYALGVSLRKAASGGSVELGTTSDPIVVAGAVADGAAVSGSPVLIGGQDGTNVQSLFTDTSGRQRIVGAAADGAAVAGDPVLIAGQDGTSVQSLKTDSTGRQETVGAAASGAAVAGNPVLSGGSDGTNAQALKTDTSGRQLIVGAAAAAAAIAGNPVAVGIYDGTNAQYLRGDANGRIEVVQPTPAWSGVYAVNVRQSAATAAGAIVWGLYNSDATKIVHIMSIQLQLFFDGTAAATLMKYEIVKYTGVTAFSGGNAVTAMEKRTSLTPVSAARVLDTGLTATNGIAQAVVPIGTQGRVTQTTTNFNAAMREFGMASRGPFSMAIELAQNELLAIRQVATSVIGDNVVGFVEVAEL